MNSVITIFGASSPVTKYLVQLFAADGFIINILNTRLSGMEFLKTAGFPGQINITTVNMQDYTSLTSAIKMSDIVINCVDATWGNQDVTSPNSSWLASFIADCMQKYGVKKYVHISQFPKKGTGRPASVKNIVDKVPGISTICYVGGPYDANIGYVSALCQAGTLPYILLPRQVSLNNIAIVHAADVAKFVQSSISDEMTNKKEFQLVGEKMPCLDFINYILNAAGSKSKIVFIPDAFCRAAKKVLPKLPSEIIRLFSELLNPIGIPASYESPELDRIATPAVHFRKLKEINQELVFGNKIRPDYTAKLENYY